MESDVRLARDQVEFMVMVVVFCSRKRALLCHFQTSGGSTNMVPGRVGPGYKQGGCQVDAMVRRAKLATSSKLSQRGVSVRSWNDRVRRMATGPPRALRIRPSPSKAFAIRESPDQPYRTQGLRNLPHRQSRSPGQAVSWRIPPDAPPKHDLALLNSSSRLFFARGKGGSCALSKPMVAQHAWSPAALGRATGLGAGGVSTNWSLAARTAGFRDEASCLQQAASSLQPVLGRATSKGVSGRRDGSAGIACHLLPTLAAGGYLPDQGLTGCGGWQQAGPESSAYDHLRSKPMQ